MVHRTHAIVTNVLLTRPDDLERIRHLLGQGQRLLDRIRFQASSEATAEILVVHDDLVFGQARDLCRRVENACRHLGAHPDFALVGSHEDGGVERLHGGVGEHG